MKAKTKLTQMEETEEAGSSLRERNHRIQDVDVESHVNGYR